jgi:hypothetical protein
MIRFPVDLRLYYQFNRKYEQQMLDRMGAEIQAEPSLANYRQYLASLVSYHYRQQLYRSKTVLAAQLVDQAVARQLPFSVVLFDSWFLRWPLVEAIDRHHKDWIGACPKDRLVLAQGRWVQLQEYIQTIPANAYRPYKIGSHRYNLNPADC